MTATGRGGRPARGTASIEIAILMPLFLSLFLGAVVLGRTANAIGAVEQAAYHGARSASLARDPATATSQAATAVAASLASQGQSCVDFEVLVYTDEFGAPVGTPASVRVEVSCLVSYSDIDLPGVPGNHTVTADFVSPLDQYRTRP